MKFVDNNEVEMLSISTLLFLGEDLNVPKLKERFNNDFVRNKECKAVVITFMGDGIMKSFIAGIRDGVVVIIDEDTKQEYTPKEFSAGLNTLVQPELLLA
jgi:hypothetical protein